MISPADHLLDLAEWAALPEDNTRHYELQDGVLIVRPLPGALHSRAIFNFMVALEPQLPRPWDLVHLVEVVTRPQFPPCVRVPDVIVFSRDVVDLNAPRLSADQPLVLVEIIAPGSRGTDSVLKPVEYAGAGIPHYWLIELEPAVSLTAYHLTGSMYRQVAAVTGEFTTTEPFPLKIDLEELTSYRAGGKRVQL